MITLKTQLKLTLAALFLLIAFLLVRCDAEAIEMDASVAALDQAGASGAGGMLPGAVSLT